MVVLLDESWIYGLWAYMLLLHYSDQTHKGKNVRRQVSKVVLSCFNEVLLLAHSLSSVQTKVAPSILREFGIQK